MWYLCGAFWCFLVFFEPRRALERVGVTACLRVHGCCDIHKKLDAGGRWAEGRFCIARAALATRAVRLRRGGREKKLEKLGKGMDRMRGVN